MEPVGRLDPLPGWIREPATQRVMGALCGDAPVARFVGGAVRDAVLGRPVTDVDIATALPPDDVVHRLGAAGIRVVPTGLAHGTVTAVTPTRSVEITTLRHDVETDGRRAKVAYTDDWRADAERRDFTMNALFADADGTLYDPTGSGLADARAGRVRFIGDAARRIAEDYLRVLRFFRFHAHYGTGEPDADAVAACAAAASEIGRLSAERVWAELKRLLAAPDPAPMVALMAAHGIFKPLLPLPPDLPRLAALVPAERALAAAPDPLRRLATLLGTVAAVAITAQRLKLSNAERETLIALLGAAAAVEQVPARLVRRFGREPARDAAVIAAARGLEPARAAAVRQALADWVEVPFPISGDDVLALGIAPGRPVGKLLDQVAVWWEERACAPDRAACLARLREQAGV